MFDSLYCSGLFLCGAQGYQNAGGFHTIGTVTAAYGGGLLRDIFFLHREPAFLALDTLNEIWIVWIGALFQALFGNHHVFQVIRFVTDPFTTGTFIVIGVSAAQDLGYGPVMATICGITTALGGGILSKVILGSWLCDVLNLNVEYRLIIVAATGLYSFWAYNEETLFEAKLSVILISGISNIMISPQFQFIIKWLVEQQMLFKPSLSISLLLCCWLRGIYTSYRGLKASALSRQPQPWHRTRYHLMQPA